MQFRLREPRLGDAITLGIVLACIIYAVVIATGQTFGQRCSAAGHVGEDWSRCVRALANAKGET